MPGFGGLELRATGFEEQIRKIQGFGEIAEPHLRLALSESVEILESGWREIAPEGETGQYRGSIAGRVGRMAGFRGTALVETTAGASGWPYPAMLEFSERYHFRSGARSGQRTKGKVRTMLRSKRQELLRKVERAIQKTIEALVVRG